MNKWQKMFIAFGVVAVSLLFSFPPQIISRGITRFMFVGSGHTIDWLRLFLWFIAILFVTGLGMAINKEEHR